MKKFYGRYTEYHSFGRDELETKDWKELATYAAVLSKLCSEEYNLEEKPEPVEEELGYAHEIKLKSFVGSYRFKSGNSLVIEYDKNKLSDYDFNVITREVAEWGAILGAPFLKALLKICSPLLKDYEILLAYSDLLIKYTESALTEYVPPVIERRKYITQVPLGKICVPKTILLVAQGEVEYFCEKARANIINLPLLFMMRFNSEMIKNLKNLKSKLEQYKGAASIQPVRAISQNLNYHMAFVTESPRAKLFDSAYKVDFRSVKTIDELRKQSSTAPSLLDMVDLWEAFIGRRLLISQIEKILRAGYGLKPLCKLYELWCLRLVLDILKDIFGEYTVPTQLPGKFVFKRKVKGVKAEILYNTTPKRSLLVKDLKQKGMDVSTRKKPDFTIRFSTSSGKSITLISDAKYRLLQNIGDEDLSRFFWYIIDYGEIGENNVLEGLFFHVSSTSKIDQTVQREKPKIRIHLFSMKPSNVSRSKPKLKELFKHLILSLV